MLFNLIVRADEAQPMLASRMFEGTPAQLTSSYRTATGFDFNALAQLPTVMTREFESDDMGAVASLGYGYPVYQPCNLQTYSTVSIAGIVESWSS